MEIWHLGRSSFKIKGKQGTVVTDPFDPKTTGLKFPNTEADIITVSHNHADHNAVGEVKGTPVVFMGPGEYESKGIKFYGLKTYHDTNEGKDRGNNTVFQITMDGIVLLHLGDLGHKLKHESIKDLKTPDIVFVPIGGTYTIDANIASEVIAHLETKIIIPMHYRESGEKDDNAHELAPLSVFLERMGKEDIAPQPKLHITKDKIPQETTVIVL